MKRNSLEVFILVGLSIIILLAANLPFFYRASLTPPGRVYLGAEGYYPDYYGIIHLMEEGRQGRGITTIFTHPKSFVHLEYALMGQVAQLLQISNTVMYHLFRTLLVAAILFLSYRFFSSFFPDLRYRLVGFFLAFLVGGIPLIQISDGNLVLQTNINFYQPADFLKRLAREPHHLLGVIGAILVMVVLFRIFSEKKAYWRRVLVLTLLGLLIGVVNFTNAFFLIGAGGLYLIIRLFSRSGSAGFLLEWLREVFAIGLLTVASVLPLVYLRLFFAKGYGAYSVLTEAFASALDVAAPFLPVVLGYALALGVLIILAGIGLKERFRQLDNKLIFLLCYMTVGALFLLVLFTPLKVSRIRFNQTPFYLPWAVLATYGFFSLSDWLHQRIKRVKLTTVHWLLFTGLLLLSLPTYANAFEREFTLFGVPPNLDSAVYPQKKEVEAITWMKDNLSKQGVVLSLSFAGRLVPALTGRPVYFSDIANTPDFQIRRREVLSFFSGQYSSESIRGFFQKNGIRYVYWGPEEQRVGRPTPEYLKVLWPIFANEVAEIFEAKL